VSQRARENSEGETWRAQFRAQAQCGERLRAWPIKIVESRGAGPPKNKQSLSANFFQYQKTFIGEFFSITKKLYRGIKSRIA
jgi:hypothetical protein